MSGSGTSTQALRALAATNPRETSFMRYFHGGRDGSASHAGIGPWTPLDQIAPLLVVATVKAEDPRFFEHRGVDWNATAQKAVMAFRGRFAGGGSTIPQQLARNLYLTPSRSLARKLREVQLALRLDRVVSKSRILELYLNVIEWGPGVWGCAAASKYYFGKTPGDLDVFESTFLPTLLPAPKAGLTGPHAPRCFRRQRLLASRLFLSGFITAEACAICCEQVRRLHRLIARGSGLAAALCGCRTGDSADASFLDQLASALDIVPIPPSDALASRGGYEQECAARERLCARVGVDAVAWVLASGSLDALKPHAAAAR